MSGMVSIQRFPVGQVNVSRRTPPATTVGRSGRLACQLDRLRDASRRIGCRARVATCNSCTLSYQATWAHCIPMSAVKTGIMVPQRRRWRRHRRRPASSPIAPRGHSRGRRAPGHPRPPMAAMSCRRQHPRTRHRQGPSPCLPPRRRWERSLRAPLHHPLVHPPQLQPWRGRPQWRLPLPAPPSALTARTRPSPGAAPS